MRTRSFIVLASALCLAPLLAVAAKQSAVASQSKPNIILIFADDLGYGDLGCYGGSVATPTLDRLAAEGLRATDCLVAANVCGPSRAALMTGRYPMRAGHPISRHDTPKYAAYGIAPEEVTMAELLKSAGYYTKIVGKWHLGFHVEGSHPLDAGFDDYLGLHSNFVPQIDDATTLYHNHDVVEKDIAFEKVTQRYTDEVVDFIQGEHEAPFFIYFAHHIAHSPILPSQPFKGSSGIKGREGNYADFVLELDASVGRVREAVEAAGLAENTLIVFLSDNGPARDGSAKPLLGGKYVTMEGGHRVPAIFNWPGQIPAGQVSDAMISSMDLLPTFAGLAGAALPQNVTLDGTNIFDLLSGKTEQSPRDYFYYYNGVHLQAVRNEKWKLHFPRTAKEQPYWAKKDSGQRVYTTLKQPLLFRMDSDAGEKKNVYAQHPEIVAELSKVADRARAELGDIDRNGSDQRPHGLENPQDKK
ncbi:sulfatase [Coraliomargarita algicola]|uniref:Sulfatase n=1 Tax=Coraliomargarita algicola TaxID=3092156 RepID=A0ABZ0RKE4_9BACT|nr:sulfatase [Coraliomargarita sp. J2-16]WPJ95470.1 sulfatase [Coraliomargarita sp. J2-16]